MAHTIEQPGAFIVDRLAEDIPGPDSDRQDELRETLASLYTTIEVLKEEKKSLRLVIGELLGKNQILRQASFASFSKPKPDGETAQDFHPLFTWN